MTSKIFKSVFLAAMAVFVASFAVFFFFTYDYYNDRLEEEVTREAEVLEKGYDEADDKSVYLDSLELDGAFVTLVASDGTVLFDTRAADTSSVQNHREREEVKEALQRGEGFAVRFSETEKERIVYCARLTEDGNVLRVGTVHYSASAVFTSIITPSMLLLLGAMLVAFFVAVYLSGSIVKPINEMNLDDPEGTQTYPELQPIIKKLASQSYKITRQMNELKKRELEFDSITGNMTEGMIIINSRTAVLSCNKSARRIFGIGDGEITGGVLSVCPTDGFRAAIASALAGKHGYDTLYIGDKVYSLLVTPVLNGVGVDGAVIMIIDDTEKESREKLRREFTANVSHELKTPLTSITGFAELIEGGIADGNDAVRFAGNIRREASRLIVLVGDIIRLNQLEGGEIPFDDAPIPLKECCSDVVLRLEAIAANAGISLELGGDEVEIRGNRQILEQIAYNLVDNAIKYNKVGGRVEISTGKSETEATLSVRDTGIGIPADKLDRIFERFYRVDKSHSKEIGGTGLGLSIVKHAALYHGAKIFVESEYGKGTEIKIKFPILTQV